MHTPGHPLIPLRYIISKRWLIWQCHYRYCTHCDTHQYCITSCYHGNTSIPMEKWNYIPLCKYNDSVWLIALVNIITLCVCCMWVSHVFVCAWDGKHFLAYTYTNTFHFITQNKRRQSCTDSSHLSSHCTMNNSHNIKYGRPVYHYYN